MNARNLTPTGTIRAVLLFVWCVSATAYGQLTWTGFNDQVSGPGTGTNATAWDVFGTAYGGPGTAGPLMNIATGETLPVTLTINSSGTIGQGSSSGAPNVGTPAYSIFNGTIDWSQGIGSGPQIYPGAEVDYVFSGLDVNKRYGFVGTGIRGGSGGDYPLRWTLMELVGANSFSAAHTTGAGACTNGLSPAQVAINTGMNAATGDCADWENIAPGDDGTFTIRCTQYAGSIPGGTAGGAYGYALMAIRLQEAAIAPAPVAFTVQPTNQTVRELYPVAWLAVASGNPAPTYQWYQNGAPLPYATNDSYAIASAAYALNNATFYVVASNMVTNTSFVVTSSVARLTVQADTAHPTVIGVFPPTNATVTALSTIQVVFSKAVSGVDASDLLINGNPATDVVEQTADTYNFFFPQPDDGRVTVTWAATNGIQDWSASSNSFNGWSFAYTLNSHIDYSVVRINEFLASNKHGIHDEDGGSSDWIELYNAGASAISLEGWYLTDDKLNLNKWRIPAVTIANNGFLLIWASGKNRANPAAPLHTSFKLNKGGGYLALVLPDGTNISSAFSPSYPQQYDDISYGRDRIEPSMLGYFTTPTPRAPNAALGAGFGPVVSFSRPSGDFITPFNLILTTTSTNAVIRYTIGTNIPTSSNAIYAGPIAISNTLQIRARAFPTVAGQLPGDIQTGNYFLLDTNTSYYGFTASSFNSKLPIVVFHNYGGGAVPAGDPSQFMIMEVFDTTNALGRSSLTNAPDLVVKGAFHRRGQATINNPKSNFRVETQDEYGSDLNVPLLGYPDDNDWIFYGIDQFDKVLMHNPLTLGLYRDMGHYSSRARYVEVYLKDDAGAPGPITAADYNGLYVLEEKIKIGKNRVDIDQLEPENSTEPSVTGGYLVSIDKSNPGNPMNVAGASIWNLNPDYYTITAPQQKYISNYFNNFYATLTPANWTNATGTNHYSWYMDMPSWIDYHLHQTLVFNADMLRISAYFYKTRDGAMPGKIVQGPLWDFDRAFADSSDARGFNPRLWRSVTGDAGTDPFNYALNLSNGSLLFSNPWYSKLFTDPDFWQKWIDRYQELRRGIYSLTNLMAKIDYWGNQAMEAAPRDAARWSSPPPGQPGPEDTAPRSGSQSADGLTYVFPTPGTYQGEINFVKYWFSNRVDFMDGNFLAPPTLSRAGGQITPGFNLTITPAAEAGSSVFYTLDGSDPRLPGGAISPTATSNNGPVTILIANNARVLARSWNPNHQNQTGTNAPPISSPWSGITVESYYLAIPSLRITELMYNPYPPPAGDTNDPQNFEYVELTNIGSNALSLIGFRFTNGIDFTFTATNNVTSLPPGGRVLIVANFLAFISRYPGLGDLVAGEYGGHLNNGGDRISLIGPMAEPICDFTYDNNWYPLTDGIGFSLVPVNEGAIPSGTNASQWRPSAYDGGSPGAPDPAPISVLPVLVNEIMTYPVPPGSDAIELFNPNPTPVDLSYWYLTDDHTTPQKYLIPPGTTIAPFKFVVFSAASSFGVHGSINAFNMVNDAFGFSSAGEEVYVYSGDATGHLTGYYQGFNFGASAQGVTFGRYVNSIGEVDLVAQSVPTFGSTNAPPLVGPVVISEIMYDPPDLYVGGVRTSNVRDEFIELRSITNAVVPLYDPAHPTNTWHIRDGVSFDFPMGVTLPANGFALVVGFDPAQDPVSLGAFRGRYGLSTNVPIYGPYAGNLDDGGAQVELRSPSTPDAATGIAPMVLVDRVHYGVTNPWPATANGTGASLQRKVLTGFGNDPTNWFAAGPSAGADYVAGTPPSITAQPQPVTAAELSSPSFSVSVGGTGPFLYQWSYNGQPINGAYGSSLVLTNVQVGQAGDYSVLVLSGSGLIQSSNAHLTVLPLPIITQQPVSTNVPPYGAATFRVSAIGTGPLSYRWQFNGTNVTNNGTTIAGATTNTLVLTNLLYDSAGLYQVLVTDSVGTRVSQAATLGVMQKPVITNQAVGVTVVVGQTIALSVGLDGTPPFYCRWRRNAQTLVPIGSNLLTLTLTNAVLTNGGTYDVIVTNLAAAILGGSTYAHSSNAYVNVVQPPTNQVVPPGTNVTLRALVGGPISFTNRFWWFSNDTVIRTGSNGAGLNWILFTNDLVLTNVTSAQSGRYTFLLSNAVITTITNINTNTVPAVTNVVSVTNYPVPPAAFTATLVVGYPPLIGQQPSNQTTVAGNTVSFNVAATGSDPLGYQWQFNGQVLAGQTGPGLTLSQVQASQSGGYSVIVTNPAGSVTSRVAVLTVLLPPVILQQPTNQAVDAGTNAVFVVVADGTPPLTYQWWFNATNWLAGATDVTVTITNVQATNVGSYQVVVSNAVGVVTSLVATLSFTRTNTAPRLAAIQDQVVKEGRKLTVRAVATDDDVPANQLMFSLGTGSPEGAVVDSATGVFTWKPREFQGPSTNLISLIVSDNGVPALSATQTFAVVVLDALPDFLVSLGSTNVLAGQSSTLPIQIETGIGLSNLTCLMDCPTNLLGDWQLGSLDISVGSASLTPSDSNGFNLVFASKPGVSFLGTQQLAQFTFTAAPDQPSGFVQVSLVRLLAMVSDGSRQLHGTGAGGRVAVIGPQPLLEAICSTNGARQLLLYGHPGDNCVIEFSPNLGTGLSWQVFNQVTLTNTWQAFPVMTDLTNTVFFRAYRNP